jgi:transcriptional regulator GlxA family with amidase domain
MSIFAAPHYTSDITQFIEEMKARKPTLEAEQLAGRALLWDRQLDRDLLAEFREGQVPQQPYVYMPQGE